jgi:glycosyltransferase involved in cell wall biosynthesis
LLDHQAKRLKELIAKPLATDKKKILVYHAQPYGVFPEKERANGYDKVIINTVWETTKVPENWFPNINQADAVIVPSRQNVQALRDSGVTVPIIRAPHGADVETFNPDNEKFPFPEIDGKFKFLSIFQWQHRKGPEKLLKAYWKEFSPNDDVALIIKSYWGNHGIKQDQRLVMDTIMRYKEHLGYNDSNSAPIYFTGSLFDDKDLRGLYTMSDVYVLPTRGEGVGLPFIESMASGIPCIATNWGGQTDFINEKNGYLLDYELMNTTAMNDQAISQNFFHLFSDDMKWAEADINHLSKLMRHTYNYREEVKEKGAIARKDMESMTWASVGENLKIELEKVVL